MKSFITIRLGQVSVDLGWFPGEPFAALELELLKYDPQNTMFVVFSVKLAKLLFAVLYTW